MYCICRRIFQGEEDWRMIVLSPDYTQPDRWPAQYIDCSLHCSHIESNAYTLITFEFLADQLNKLAIVAWLKVFTF